MVARHIVVFSSESRAIMLIMLISCDILSFDVCLVTLMLRINFKCATSIGITLQKFILYTLASLGSANPPTNFIFMHMCKLETKPFEHICRGSYHYLIRFYDAYQNSNI